MSPTKVFCCAVQLRRDSKLELIQNIWRGNIGLAPTYWFFGTFLGLAISFMGFLISEQSAFLLVLYFAFVLLYMVWISVGIWRSAGKYQGKRVWIALARLGVILGALQGIATFGPLLLIKFQ
jgi:hypothetical protein